jgi:hypothetical protein
MIGHILSAMLLAVGMTALVNVTSAIDSTAHAAVSVPADPALKLDARLGQEGQFRGGAPVDVIVRVTPGSENQVRDRITAAGGRVATSLPIINGVVARLNHATLLRVAKDEHVLSLSTDGSVTPRRGHARRTH